MMTNFPRPAATTHWIHTAAPLRKQDQFKAVVLIFLQYHAGAVSACLEAQCLQSSDHGRNGCSLCLNTGLRICELRERAVGVG